MRRIEVFHQTISAQPIITSDGREITATCSFGVACVIAGERFSRAALIDQADAALYCAKDAGRNAIAYIFYQQATRQICMHQRKMHSGLNLAQNTKWLVHAAPTSR